MWVSVDESGQYGAVREVEYARLCRDGDPRSHRGDPLALDDDDGIAELKSASGETGFRRISRIEPSAWSEKVTYASGTVRSLHLATNVSY